MAQKGIAIAAWTAAALAIAGTPAAAQVLDAEYRGTLVCDKLPFMEAKMREAIAVTIASGAAKYRHVVRLYQEPESKAELGTGTLSGQAISLQGTWDGGARQYKANYSGNFVRRSARLKGTQIWTIDGKTVTRDCSGVIKRPLKAFLPRKKRPARPS
jgi:class 3 adenylate cyclase